MIRYDENEGLIALHKEFYILYNMGKGGIIIMATTDSKYSAELITNWLLSQSEMSPKKLQKMLYYCYSWVLTLMNDKEKGIENKLFKEKFEAWVHGPVIPSIYNKYRENGYNDIPKLHEPVVIEDQEILDILQQVYEEYGHFTGNQLESISHQEDPWINSRKGYGPFEASDVEIVDEDIFNCYIQRVI